MKNHANKILAVVLGLLAGVVAGSIAAGLAASIGADFPPDRRGIMACNIGGGVQVVSFVPGWDPPDTWRCAIAVEPREWIPDNPVFVDAINLEIGGACGWTETAGACCPECLAWERGCPTGPEGCGDGP